MVCEYYRLAEADRFPMGPLRINVSDLYERMPIKKQPPLADNFISAYQNRFHRYFYGSPLIPFSLKVKLKTILRNSGIDNVWLRHFQKYWGQLGGRPLHHPSDFFFLRNFYRVRQPPLADNTIEDVDTHLEAWQNPEYIFPLFSAVFEETFASDYEILKLFSADRNYYFDVLEFGCGSANTTSAIIQHRLKCFRKASFVISDIPTLTFHYAGYKFRNCRNVRPITLEKQNDFRLVTDKRFDVVFCCQVFEHLNDPVQTVKTFYNILKQNGILVFDYILSEAKGLDSMQGLAYRDDVLKFIGENYTIEHGSINKSTSIGTTIARKVE